MRSFSQQLQQAESRLLVPMTNVLNQLHLLQSSQSSTSIQISQPLPNRDPDCSDAEELESCVSDLRIQDLEETEEDQEERRNDSTSTEWQIESTHFHSDEASALGCKRNCPCLCHQPWIMRVAIAKCLGFAHIKLRGLPLLSGRCTDRSCAGRSSNIAVEMNLRFPPWLLSKAVALSVLSSRWHEPCFNLRVRNIISWSHPWFKACRGADIDQARQLLRECPSRVNDVNEHGYNALAVSEQYKYGFSWSPEKLRLS